MDWEEIFPETELNCQESARVAFDALEECPDNVAALCPYSCDLCISQTPTRFTSNSPTPELTRTPYETGNTHIK